MAAAAREIGLTAAAAGQQLQQLEADIGVELWVLASNPISAALLF